VKTSGGEEALTRRLEPTGRGSLSLGSPGRMHAQQQWRTPLGPPASQRGLLVDVTPPVVKGGIVHDTKERGVTEALLPC
jgi:hypothetical protein